MDLIADGRTRPVGADDRVVNDEQQTFLAQRDAEAHPALAVERPVGTHLDGAAPGARSAVGADEERQALALQDHLLRAGDGARRPGPHNVRAPRAAVRDHRIGARMDLLHAAGIAAVHGARHRRRLKARPGRVRVAVAQPHQAHLERRLGGRHHQLDVLAGGRAPATGVADQLPAAVIDDPRHARQWQCRLAAAARRARGCGRRSRPAAAGSRVRHRHHRPVLERAARGGRRTCTRARRPRPRASGRPPSTRGRPSPPACWFGYSPAG